MSEHLYQEHNQPESDLNPTPIDYDKNRRIRSEMFVAAAQELDDLWRRGETTLPPHLANQLPKSPPPSFPDEQHRS